MPIQDRLTEIEDRVVDGDGVDPAGVTVEWRDAAPDERPEGMAWTPEERRLEYDFWHAQRDVLDVLAEPETDLAGFVAGYRSGKSILGARWLLTQALTHSGTRHLAMGQDFQKAQGATYRTLFESLPGDRTDLVTSGYNGPESSPVVADYNRTRHTLTLTNDSVVVLGAGDRWSRHAGEEFAAIWCDEVAHYDESLHDLLEMLGSRLTAGSGPNKMLWTTTGAGFNDAHSILEKRVDEDGDPLGLNLAVVKASVLENPYLDDATRDRLRRQYEGSGREEQALHGGFASQTGLVYSKFDRQRHIVPHAEAAEVAEDRKAWYGLDVGWSSPTAVIELHRTPYGQLVALDEFYEREAHTEDVLAWLEQNGRTQGEIYAEHEPAVIDRLERAGWYVTKAEKSLTAGIAEVRRFLEVDDHDRPGLLVSDRCENLIAELQSYKEEHVGKSVAQDHLADALRYCVMGVSGASARPALIVSKHSAVEGERYL